ncbi:MAG TPA: hypothetical protein PKE40_08080 [Arachnia sp.]|nr:hypothetical protein [Arachnia sp.]HMT86293.1 hypothetical protein [Arachnia sp.]
MSSSIPEGPFAELTSATISRRAVVQASAWSTPVIAVAATAPMAAATVEEKTVAVAKMGTLEADNGAAEGKFTPQALFASSDSAEQWNTGTITVTVALSGPWEPGATILDGEGEPWGATATSSGIVWSVSVVEPVGGPPSVVFTSTGGADVTGTGTVDLPEATFSGTYDPAAVSPANPITTSVTVEATNVALPAAKSLHHDGPRTIYTPVPFNAPTWTMDRAEPQARTADANSLTVTIGTPSTNSNRYYRFEGVRAPTAGHITEEQAIPAGVNNVRATLHFDPTWIDVYFVTAELWIRAPYSDPATEGNSAFPTIFMSAEGGIPYIEVFDLYGVVHRGPRVAEYWLTLEVAHDPFADTFSYYANGDLIHTESAFGARHLDTVFFNHQNPNHPAAQSESQTTPAAPFTVVWSDLEFGERIDLGSYTG